MKRLVLIVAMWFAFSSLLSCSGETSTPLLVEDDLLVPPDLGQADRTAPEDDAIAVCEEQECVAENEFGTCFGVIPCEKGRAGECTAAVPAPEECNGLDDDCNGAVDDADSLCDDENPCTQDSCDPEAGCQHENLDGELCDDGDMCTADGLCVEGVCETVGVVCDDEKLCTDDSCDPAVGCVFANNTAPCDDLDPCTVNDLCADGACGGFEVPCDCQLDTDCVALDDGDLCNGTLFCDLEQFPPQCAVDEETVIVCPKPEGVDTDCLQPLCHGETGDCSFAAANEEKACSDGDACTMGETCVEGVCGQGNAVNCNDGNSCTDDSCEAEAGCIHANNSSACEDGNVCSVDDICLEGQCQGGAPLLCDDGNPCTNDACDEGQGCVFEPNEESCDDGNICTLGDQCQEGVCGAGSTESCDDGNPCTDDLCHPLDGCVYENNTAPCNDANICTISDSCEDGVCVSGPPLNCDDSTPCTTDACQPEKGCYYDYNEEPCEDGNICTVADACENAKCVPGAPVACDDGNPCTDDSCDPDQGCLHAGNEAQCDDNNECTDGDQCSQGLCQGTGSTDCDDGNPCTKDICLPQGGCLHEDSSGAFCDDLDPCSVGDVCVEGTCQSGLVKNCDDGNPCTSDVCGEEGNCGHEANSESCDDSNACTVDDTCAGGQCAGAVLVDCDDDHVCTTDSCDPAIGCVYADNTAPCTDGSVCTLGDQCQEGLCVPGFAVLCNDGNPCTTDSCDPVEGCQQAANEDGCDDGNPCTAGDTCVAGACKGVDPVVCDDENPCTDDFCHPFDGCTYVPNVDLCDDDDLCTTVDQCVDGVCAGSQPLDCDDENDCTDDDCDAVEGCQYEDNTLGCDDADQCTTVDQCADGECVGSVPLECDDTDPCTADNCDPAQGCQFEPIIPCCGNGILDSGEECDQGLNNGGKTLDSCTVECTHFGAYKLVLSVGGDGAVLAGDWDNAYEIVANQMRECKVRFDNRLARVSHLEFSSESLRFDFQDLNAWHNGWDSYAFVIIQPNLKAGFGASYRKGHDNDVWKKSIQQNGEYSWQGTQVDLYCEREDLFQHVATVDGAGKVSAGSWSDMHTAVDNGATCKVKYDGRISTVVHTEYTQNRIYFDLLGLHAHYNSWDSYAYLDLLHNSRGGVAAAYRRGQQDEVWKTDRAQHGEAEFHAMTTAVHCKDTFSEEFIALADGGFSKGDFETLHGYVADEGRDCKVFYDGRVSQPAYIEYTDSTLRFDFMHLHAYHDQWDSFAGVMIQDGSYAGIRVSYRRGHVDHIWKKTLAQHAGKAIANLTIRVHCEGDPGYTKVYEIDGSGADVVNEWAGFRGPLASHDRGFDCKVRYDGRVTHPPLIEHGTQSGFEVLLFDEISLTGRHDAWEAYATNVAFADQSAGIGASYRRGHHNNIWMRDRQQSLLYSFQQMGLEYLCK